MATSNTIIIITITIYTTTVEQDTDEIENTFFFFFLFSQLVGWVGLARLFSFCFSTPPIYIFSIVLLLSSCFPSLLPFYSMEKKGREKQRSRAREVEIGVVVRGRERKSGFGIGTTVSQFPFGIG